MFTWVVQGFYDDDDDVKDLGLIWARTMSAGSSAVHICLSFFIICVQESVGLTEP